MKKNKIKRFPFLLVFTVCIVSAFAFLMAITNSNITNLIATDPNTEFNITYDLKDGKFEENITAPTKYKYIEETSIPNPVKEGSEFLGWTINDKEGEPVKDYKIPKGTSGDIKLTANWKVLQVKLMSGQIFNDTIKRMSDFYNVTKIQFVKGTPNQSGTDVSEAQDRSIMASIEGDVLTVASENTIYANENSANTFFGAEYYYIESYIESIDLSNFDTSNVTDMESMFYGCNSLTSIKGLENFDTSQVTNMSQMFYDCAKIRTLNVSNFDTSNVANMSDMFSMCDLLSDIKGLENFNTSQVTTMESMFYGCDSLTSLNLSNWNTSNVIRAGSMFSFCSGLRTIDLSNWKTSNLKVIASMFDKCKNLETIKGLNNFDTSNVTHFSGMFEECNKLSASMTIANPNVSSQYGYNNMFLNCSTVSPAKFVVNYTDNNTKTVAQNMVATKGSGNVVLGGMPSTLVDGSTFNSTIKGMSGFANVTEIRFEQKSGTLSGTDISEVKDGSIKARISGNILYVEANGEIFANKDCTSMFYEFGEMYGVLNKITFENFNTSKVTKMSSMFSYCEQLTNIDLSNFDTSNVTTMYRMFNRCIMLTSLDLSNFNTSKVTNMESMFYQNLKLQNINVSNFDTSNVTTMYYMFRECNKLQSIDLSNFNTSNVTNMHGMFYWCGEISQINGIENFNTSKVNNMGFMFDDCYNLQKINADNWDTSKVNNMREMFSQCRKLNGSITIANPNLTRYAGTFTNCSIETNSKFYVKYIDDATKAVAEQMIVSKSENSNVFLYETSKLVDGKTFNTILNEKMIANNVDLDQNIIFRKVNKSELGSGQDISASKDGSIKLVTEAFGPSIPIRNSNKNNSRIRMGCNYYIQSDKIIEFNENSSYMFDNLCKNSYYSITFDNIDTSKVTNMSFMFNNADVGSIKGIEKFNTNQVTNMNSMFANMNKTYTKLNLSSFNIKNIKTMDNMFNGSKNLSGEIRISNPNISSYKDMFKDCSTDPSAKFVVKYTDEATKTVAEKMVATKSTNSNVYLDGTQPAILVDGSTFLAGIVEPKLCGGEGLAKIHHIRFTKELPIIGEDVSEAQDGSIKARIEENTLIVSSDSKIFANPNSEGLFSECPSLENIEFNNFDTSKVTDMSNMFSYSMSLTNLDLSNFNTSKVITMYAMFNNCSSLTNLDVSNWDMNSVGRTTSMFENCTNLKEIKGIQNLIDTALHSICDSMFKNCSNLSGEVTIETDREIDSIYYYFIFAGCSTDPSAKLIVNYSNKGSFSEEVARAFVNTADGNVILKAPPAILISGAKFNEKIMSRLMSVDGEGKHIIFEKGDVTNLPSDAYSITDVSEAQDGSIIMYSKRSSNKYIITPITDTEIHIVSPKTIEFNEDCSNMFSLENKSGYKINSIKFNNIDTSKVKNMSSMFKSNYYLNELDLSNFNTSKVTDMSSMFENCSNLSGEMTISNPNITKYTDMFLNCSTNSSADFTVKYTSDCKEMAQKLVNTKSSNSNVSLSNRDHTGGNSNDVPNKEEPSVPDTVTLTIKDGNTTTTKEILAGEIGSLNTPSKEGMIFSGYFYDEEFTKPVSERDIISEDTTIYIKWEEVPQVEENPQEENKDESIEVA